MPQLNPAPWLMIFTLVWAVFIIMLTKILNSKPHPTIPQHNKQFNSLHWAWPWS
uniref:ATP synthase complex subunit 8 n=1 Tax=Phoenicolacerta kulzeri TaxID=575499 RepID=B7U9H8_9SAUR|nr:ATP synthase F0 subunit 8 [Phoenicolacerta kulzeri]ACJ54963.1 ATP synthase F0 subunit 8 [Phoenicolacerta kulzeri]